MKTLIKAAVAAAIGMGVAAGSMPALAGPAGAEVHSTTVSFSDLNLSREAGVNELYGRLKAAARTVCGSRPDGRNLVMSFYWKQCYDGALDSAVGKVAHVGLTEVHLASTGRRVGSEHQVAAQ
ncbi:MAG TPA: UrcA family protein [Gammaproteobacteria bacterium]|jgi:UrcA family protein